MKKTWRWDGYYVLSVKHISVAADSLIALRDFLTKFNYIKDLLETYEAGRVVLLH